jgi:hypothetical protein
MGLFDFFADPASKWVRAPGLKLDVELREASLCGVRLGSRPDGLSRLGPTSNPNPSKRGFYLWEDLGLDASAVDGILVAFSLVVNHQDFEPDDGTYAGAFLLDGKPLPLTAETRKEDVIRLLGEPWHQHTDEDDDEIAHSMWYETRTLEWTFEFVPGGTLATVVLASPPDLAEARTRGYVKCDKPWPP